MADDPKHIVASGYDTCGRRYSAARAQDPSPEIEQLLGTLSPHATVLDIGCGAGVPVVSALSRSCKVVGVDISSVQIEQARLNVPQATFMLGDIMAMEFAPRTFDAVVSFYTLFHLPREEHGLLLERIALWLRPGGHLLFTVANSSHPGYTEPDFFGATMYWSHFERGTRRLSESWASRFLPRACSVTAIAMFLAYRQSGTLSSSLDSSAASGPPRDELLRLKTATVAHRPWSPWGLLMGGSGPLRRVCCRGDCCAGVRGVGSRGPAHRAGMRLPVRDS